MCVERERERERERKGEAVNERGAVKGEKRREEKGKKNQKHEEAEEQERGDRRGRRARRTGRVKCRRIREKEGKTDVEGKMKERKRESSFLKRKDKVSEYEIE